MSGYPYPGLRPFERDETDIFFGRENQTDSLVGILEKTHFLAVLGASGCGKSSLVRNGLLSALDSGFMGSVGANWAVVILRPGNQPFANLAEQLLKDETFAAHYSLTKDDSGLAKGILEAELRRGPLSLHEILKANPLPEACRLHIVVDQFEELFRFDPEAGENLAEVFVDFILHAYEHEKVYITITMRSDFLGNCTRFLGLPEAISRGLYLTPKLTREEMAEAISLPAKVYGGEIEPELVNRLLNEVNSSTQDQLPLLQHALSRMWHLDEDKHITLKEYQIYGGLQKTLSNHVDKAYMELSENQQRIAETMFRKLTQRGNKKQDIRCPSTIAEIIALTGATLEEVVNVVDAFRKPGRSFLTPGYEIELSENTLIDISHESLIRQWSRLRKWNKDEAKRAELYQRMASAALRWKNKTGELWRGFDLQQAIIWKSKFDPGPQWAKRYQTGESFDYDATMQFLKNSEAEQNRKLEQEARQRGAKYRRLVYSAIILFGLIIGGTAATGTWFYWYVWENESYFDSFTKHWGLPVGLVELSESQVKQRMVSFKLTRQGIMNPVDSIEAIDNQGRCTTSHNVGTYIAYADETVAKRRPCRWEFVRDSKDEVVSEKAFDRNNFLAWAFVYTPHRSDIDKTRALERRALFVSADGYVQPQQSSKATSVRFEYTPEGYQKVVWFTDQAGTPALGRDKQFGQSYEYNAKGQVVKMTSLDKDRNPMNDIVGNAILTIEYDARGFRQVSTALDTENKPVLTNLGYAISRYKFDENGNLLETRYFDEDGNPALIIDDYHKAKNIRDNNGNITEYYYYDTDGNPTYAFEGYHYATQVYDEFYNPIEVSYFDENKNPVAIKNGFAKFAQAFDEKGNLLWYEYYDERSQFTLASKGFARAEFEHDKNGNTTRAQYLDTQGQPTTLKSGFSSWTANYNSQNKQLEKRYFDTAGEPVLIDQGYAIYINTYDKNGNILSGSYFGTNEEEVLSKEGYAEFRNIFDQSGNITQVSYFGTDGKLMPAKKGYAGYRMEYDDKGNKVRESYFDTIGANFVLSAGYAIVELEYDNAGNKTASHYLDSAGKLTTRKEKYSSWRADYDARGNLIETRYYNINGDLVTTSWGYAKAVNEYNNRSQLITVSFFNAYSRRALSINNYASKDNVYDQQGNNTETSYWGISDDPVAYKEVGDDFEPGYHKVTREFDKFGRAIKVSFFDTNGLPETSDLGYSSIAKNYDRFGHNTETSFFDGDNKPVRIYPGGYHEVVKSHDVQGRITSYRYYAKHRVAVHREEGYHEIRIEYDNRGLKLRELYLDNIQNLVNTNEGCAVWLYEYDSRGNTIEISSLDEAEQACMNRDGYAKLKYRYDQWSQLTGSVVFDAEGNPAVYIQGWHSWEGKFDTSGNRVKKTFFDRYGDPVELADGFASWTSEYDAYGNVIGTRYYGKSGENIINSKYRYHRFENTFNERQQKIASTTYDAEDNLMISVGNYAHYTNTYDDFGNLVEIATFDEQWQPIVNDYGWAKIQYKYDRRGNLIEESYYNHKNRPMSLNNCRQKKWEYNEVGVFLESYCASP